MEEGEPDGRDGELPLAIYDERLSFWDRISHDLSDTFLFYGLKSYSE